MIVVVVSLGLKSRSLLANDSGNNDCVSLNLVHIEGGQKKTNKNNKKNKTQHMGLSTTLLLSDQFESGLLHLVTERSKFCMLYI